MTIGSISAAGLSQYVLTSSNSNSLQQILQTLQNTLSSGDLNAAQSAFSTLQNLNQTLATASGSSLSSSSPLSTDLTALGNALNSGDLSTAQSAFTTVRSDLKNAASPSQTTEANVATQSQQLVAELLSTLNASASSGSSDLTNSVLEKVYGSPSFSVHA
jgi:hypothetical protein